ncbi:glycoside hydrolase family 15 protein [Halogeometricum sp. S1BR25-6]|uniref:Glycoside hydrolase family 15 protein n=1 Tax=Halogeometricum salsisoli TaxID=2950536 RepID=A0ABU2GML2_9EURY|nr:glycoside hydrolase family 15 protein [Halogeometricum sp. S1BR25-6]MDS0301313.1 glycoside hydrolase family 15 protein [Halogeometricum sp. S1BR25-6]
MSTPDRAGMKALATVNRYDGTHTDWHGALVEETSAFRLDIELFYDLHTLIWDADRGETLDVRNDAVESSVTYESSRVPEIHVENRFEFADGESAVLTQDIITSVNTCGLLLRNRASFSSPGERTLYTLLGLGIKGHDHDHPHAVQDAYHVDEGNEDFLVAHDQNRYLAAAQERSTTDDRRFDGLRIGKKGHRSGTDKSAWNDVYVENDGYIDSNTYNHGDLDAAFGLYAGEVTDVEWVTAIGYCRGEEWPISHAREMLDNGYERERNAFAEAWTEWHDGVTNGPTDDERANELYEKSLTSMKCAQDSLGAMIAGAFKPRDMTYKFVWPRDQVIMIQALAAAEAYDEARDALGWLDDVQITTPERDERGIDRGGTWWQNYYTSGDPHWRALQLDQVGGPIYAHWLLWRETDDRSVLTDHYEMSRRAAEFLLAWDNGEGFPKRHQDPWEETWGYSTEGVAAAIAGLRSMAAMADERDETEFATRCRECAGEWEANFDDYCFARDTPYGDHYVTAASPETAFSPSADERPDAAAFMAYWPWNVVDADGEPLRSTLRLAGERPWNAPDARCIGRYPGDCYTPTGTAEVGGWPLCEAYADVARWQSETDEEAVRDHLFDDALAWTTAAGLLPERVDEHGRPHWNANLQWSQAMFVLLTRSHVDGTPFGFAPDA